MNERRGRAHTSCFPPGFKTWTVSIRIDGGVPQFAGNLVSLRIDTMTTAAIASTRTRLVPWYQQEHRPRAVLISESRQALAPACLEVPRQRCMPRRGIQ